MEQTASRACATCKTLKIKCNRIRPICNQCEKSGKSCSYPDGKQIRFRDETDRGASLAIRKWRARSTKSVSPVEPDPIPVTIFPSLDDLARGRFLFDFAPTDTSPFVQDIPGKRRLWAAGTLAHEERSSVYYALDAVAFANFGRRQHDLKASNKALVAHTAAVRRLKETIDSNPGPEDLAKVALTAVILGLYDSIRLEKGTAGSWIFHFCGAVNIVMLHADKAGPYVQNMARLLTKQALIVCLRANCMINLPPAILDWLTKDNEIESTIVGLGWRTAAIILSGTGEECENYLLRPEYLPQALEMNQSLHEVEVRAAQEIPYRSTRMEPDEYPLWFRPMAKRAGFPQTSIVYSNIIAAFHWNVLRYVQISNLVRLLNADLPPEVLEVALAKALQVMEDICASVFFILSSGGAGRGKPTTLDEVPGSAAYTQNVILHSVREILQKCTVLREASPPMRLECVSGFLQLFSDGIGLTEPIFWENTTEQHKQELIEQLTFANASWSSM